MATWTIISGPGTTGSGTQLVGCTIKKKQVGGTVTYEFKAPKAGATPPVTPPAPDLTNIPFNGSTWSVSSTTAPPTWSGSCSNTTSPTGDPGTWTAVSGSGGEDDDDDVGTTRKRKKRAKATGKKSAKSAKSVKSASSAKTTKGTKSAKSSKGTKSTKRTRGRG